MSEYSIDNGGPRSKTLGTILAALIAVGSLILAGVTHSPKTAGSSPSPAKAALVPQIADAKSDREVLFRGKSSIEFKREVILRFTADIDEISVTEGQEVKRGDVLASYTLDRASMMQVHDTLFSEIVLRMEQTLYDQELALEKLTDVHLNMKRLRIEKLDKELADIEQLHSKAMAQTDAIRNKRRELDMTRKEVEEVTNSIKQTSSAIQKTRENLKFYAAKQRRAQDLLEWQNNRSYSDTSIPLEKGFLKSPIDGRVIWISPQFRVGAELPGGFRAMTVSHSDEMVVRAKVHELDLVKLKLGDRGTVSFDAVPDKTYPCRVSRLPWVSRNPALEIPADYEIECVLDNSGGNLKEGLTCNVKISIKD